MGDPLICRRARECGGCSLWEVPASEQARRKREAVRAGFSAQGLVFPTDVESVPLPDRGLRDRLDFQIRQERRGLWDKTRSEILDLPQCLQLSPPLQAWLDRFREIPLSVRKGSFRLRVSPGGQRGVWLDLSHEDVKALFEETESLRQMAELASVEIGQKRKPLVFQEGRPKLQKEPRLQPWTRTWLNGEAFPLLSRIADFSQSGDTANRAIIDSLEKLLASGRRLVEFGSGNGNLTFPSLLKFERVVACESDPGALLALQANRAEFEIRHPHRRGALEIAEGDHRRRPFALTGADTVLVNPPRSGVGSFLDELQASPVEQLIYMSCYPESLVTDMARLKDHWYCERLIVVDQFPQSEHLEVLSRWRRR